MVAVVALVTVKDVVEPAKSQLPKRMQIVYVVAEPVNALVVEEVAGFNQNAPTLCALSRLGLHSRFKRFIPKWRIIFFGFSRQRSRMP